MQQLITNGSVPVGHDRGNLVILHAINSNEAVELASLVSQHPQRYWDQLQKTKPSSSLSMALKDFAFFSQDNPRCEYLKHLASCSYGLKLIPEDDLESNPDIFIICNGELATVSIYDDYYELFWELCCGNDTKVNYQTHVKEDGEAIRKAIYFKPSTNEDGLTSITALINPSQTEVLTNTLCVFHIDDNYQVVTNDIQQDLKKGKKRKRKKIKTKVLEHKKQPRKPKRVKVIQKHTQEVVAKTNPSNELTRTQRRKNTKTPKSTYLDIKRAYIHSSGHRNGKSN